MSIILQTVQAILINFAMKRVRLKVYVVFTQSDDLALHSRPYTEAGDTWPVWRMNYAVMHCVLFMMSHNENRHGGLVAKASAS